MRGRAAIDRTGFRYGNLTVLSRAGSNRHGHPLWLCKCDCGAETTKSTVFMGNGGRQCSKSCPMGVHVKHGATTHTSKSKEYAAWVDMKRRCFNTASPNYARYGGRGITMCTEWVDDFAAFLEHIGPAPEGKRMSVDRIDNDGNYEPGNVRWATPSEQVKNRAPYKMRPGHKRARRKQQLERTT